MRSRARRSASKTTAGGQVVDVRFPHQTISGAVYAPTAAVALGDEPSIELRREQRFQRSKRHAHRVAIRAVVLTAAERAGPVAGRQRDLRHRGRRRRPSVRGGERMPPIPELGHACDPQRAPVVADDGAVVIDEAAAVPGEQAVATRGVEVAPRIDRLRRGIREAQRRTFGRNCNTSNSPSTALSFKASVGTHFGNGVTIVRWAPDAVCSSSMASSAEGGKRSARRTSTGQMRRWTA